ncbi:hypothetical protein GALL_222910 [mine drainage metagenome]|uniref:Uncharacterized protein n=1 Tax=mine drainage metagenome TaxID=410659 RepID=A0A1J5RUE9_9ZZZZ
MNRRDTGKLYHSPMLMPNLAAWGEVATLLVWRVKPAASKW